MKRTSRTTAVILTAALFLSVFAGSASAQEVVSQVACVATGWVAAPGTGPQLKHWTKPRVDEPISVFGSGTCVKPALPPGDNVVYSLVFQGTGTTTRTGHCLAGVISDQDILVDVFLVPTDPPGPPGAVRHVRQLWTTDLVLGSSEIEVPSVYPPTHFQIRHPGARYSMRGAGAYTEPLGFDCPAKPSRSVPSVFVFTYTGADAQP